jgi:hypothetical protein
MYGIINYFVALFMHFKRSHSSQFFVSYLINCRYENNVLEVGEDVELLGAEEVCV